MRNLTVVILSSFILAIGSYSGNYRGEPKEWAYIEIGRFSGWEAKPVIKKGRIEVYKNIHYLHINNLSEADKEWVEKHMPEWKGEQYSVNVYKWTGEGFECKSTYYTDEGSETDVKFDEFDLEENRDLKLKPELLQIKEISSLLKSALVKAYAEGDLNGDGKVDFVMVYEDTTGKEEWSPPPLPANCHLVIFENKGKNKYVKKFSYSYNSGLASVGKVEIRDVTEDGKPEVILWVYEKGGSGWSVDAQIFSRMKDNYSSKKKLGGDYF